MTLDEAIEHAKEVSCGGSKCAEEHKQLAEWLEELREHRANRFHFEQDKCSRPAKFNSKGWCDFGEFNGKHCVCKKVNLYCPYTWRK